MPQESDVCPAPARPTPAQPLTALQQNILSGCPRLQLKRKTGTLEATPVIPHVHCKPDTATSIQMRLKAIGLSQYADAFAKEEIDEEVLPCLTVRDLQSLGVCNRAHQRLILSAAIQPATHQVAREESKGCSAAPIPALSIHTPSTCHPSLRDRDQCQVNSIGTDTVLPNKVLPRAGLLSIASAVAAGLTKAGAAAAASSSRLATAQQPVHGSHGHSQRPNSCKPFSAIATVAGAAAPAVCRRPLGAAATSRGGVGPVRGAHCIARGTAPAAKAVVATATDTCTTAGVVAATAGRGVTTSAGAQARDKAPGAAGARAVATAVKAAVALVPLTKTEEAHQLAMALSASMSAGATSSAVEAGLAEPPQSASVVTQPVASQPASQAASQGVFDTMMAASKQKSKGPAASASGPTASTSSCGRSHEQALLARVFASQAAAVLPPAVLSSLCVQRIAEGSSQARCVSPTRSLWVCAGRSDPPACRLQDRVKKRKTEAAVQAEVLKKQHVEQQTQQYGVPEQSSASSLADVQHTAFCEPCSLYTQDRVGKSGCSAEATERTVLASVQDDVHDKANQGTCMLSQQPAQPVLQQASTRTVEPMKRMRLQALQQELTAARQTVADLERMIKVESLS